MKKLMLAFVGLLLWACNSGQKSQETASKNEVTGILKEVDDVGYPRAFVALQTPNADSVLYFDLNLEEVKNIDMEKLRAHVGKSISCTFSSAEQPSLIDIWVADSSIIGNNMQDQPADILSVEGILEGADEPTPGDLPGTISVKPASGQKIDFEYFVIDEMVKHNGKPVKAFYEMRSVNHIKTIELK